MMLTSLGGAPGHVPVVTQAGSVPAGTWNFITPRSNKSNAANNTGAANGAVPNTREPGSNKARARSENSGSSHRTASFNRFSTARWLGAGSAPSWFPRISSRVSPASPGRMT